jgi:hypothetical protein
MGIAEFTDAATCHRQFFCRARTWPGPHLTNFGSFWVPSSFCRHPLESR